MRSDDPPALMNGRVIPVIGRRATTTPMLMNAWRQSQAVIPAASSAPQRLRRQARQVAGESEQHGRDRDHEDEAGESLRHRRRPFAEARQQIADEYQQVERQGELEGFDEAHGLWPQWRSERCRRSDRPRVPARQPGGAGHQITRARKAVPVSAIAPPSARTAILPDGKRTRPPMPTPARCSKPVATTKPAL